MATYLIIGGGIAGLVSANILREQAKKFVGLEKSEQLGGRALVGHHRLYARESVDYLHKHFPKFEWMEVDDSAKERKKGEWVEPREEFPEEELFYLKHPFYSPKVEMVKLLAEEVRTEFQFRKTVTEVDAERKIVTCSDESTYPYEKMIWCSPLELLLKAWKGDKTALLKVMKSAKEIPGGINLDLEMSQDVFQLRNTMVLPFRYKDTKLRGLGVRSTERSAHWMLFLEPEIIEDREELAKCIRTFKRELQKEFPELKAAVSSERIVYLPTISGETPTTAKTLEVMPDVVYLGPEIRLPDTDEGLRNIDRTLDNCRRFEASFAQT